MRDSSQILNNNPYSSDADIVYAQRVKRTQCISSLWECMNHNLGCRFRGRELVGIILHTQAQLVLVLPLYALQNRTRYVRRSIQSEQKCSNTVIGRGKKLSLVVTHTFKQDENWYHLKTHTGTLSKTMQINGKTRCRRTIKDFTYIILLDVPATQQVWLDWNTRTAIMAHWRE